MKQTKSGDLLLFKPTGAFDIVGNLIAAFSDNHKYCHVAIAIGNGRLLEMAPGGSNVKDISPDNVFDVFEMIDTVPNVTCGYTSLLYSNYLLVRQAVFLHEKKYAYNWEGDIGQGINEVLEGVAPVAEHLVPIINNDNQLNCSQFIALAFQNSFDLQLVDGIPWQNVKPDDIQKTRYFRKLTVD